MIPFVFQAAGAGSTMMAKEKGQRLTKRIEPLMRGSAVRSILYLAVCGALPLMAHPRRYLYEAEAP